MIILGKRMVRFWDSPIKTIFIVSLVFIIRINLFSNTICPQHPWRRQNLEISQYFLDMKISRE